MVDFIPHTVNLVSQRGGVTVIRGLRKKDAVALCISRRSNHHITKFDRTYIVHIKD